MVKGLGNCLQVDRDPTFFFFPNKWVMIPPLIEKCHGKIVYEYGLLCVKSYKDENYSVCWEIHIC